MDSRRSVQAEIRRAKADVVNRVGIVKAQAAIDAHRAGDHTRPFFHRHHCFACLAWWRRRAKREDRR